MIRERTYRHVRCVNGCIWQDFYACDGTRLSIPPRCPRCGKRVEILETVAAFPLRVRRMLGRDIGLDVLFPQPKNPRTPKKLARAAGW